MAVSVLMLNVCNRRINRLEASVSSLTQRVGGIEADLNLQVGQLIRQRIEDWESDEEFDSR